MEQKSLGPVAGGISLLTRPYGRHPHHPRSPSRLRSRARWTQFHAPENLAKSISIEAAQLLELSSWSPDADEQQIQDELADVLTYAYQRRHDQDDRGPSIRSQ